MRKRSAQVTITLLSSVVFVGGCQKAVPKPVPVQAQKDKEDEQQPGGGGGTHRGGVYHPIIIPGGGRSPGVTSGGGGTSTTHAPTTSPAVSRGGFGSTGSALSGGS